MSPAQPKPSVQLSGNDGNVFGIIGRVSLALKRAKQPERAAEFRKEAAAAKSYEEVLNLCHKYVEVE